MVPRLLVPAVSCPKCSYPNDNSFKFCQRCGYKRQLQASMTTTSLKAPINWIAIKERKDSLEKRLLSIPKKKALLFNLVLTKSLRDGSENVFALKRYKDPVLCPVVAQEVYIKMCDIRRGYLFRPISPSGDILPGPFDSSAAQARLISYAKRSPMLSKETLPNSSWP